MIYKIFDDAMNFASFSLDLESVLDILDPHIGEQAAMQFSQLNLALSEYWKPLSITLRSNDESQNKLPDLTLWRSASCIMSGRALKVLENELSAFGEFLPLTYQGERCALFNCLKQIDADPNNSSRVEEQGYFMDVEHLAFPADTNELMFKCPYENNRNLFCSIRFKKLADENRLGGIYFGEDLAEPL
jgi:hypothetical protein